MFKDAVSWMAKEGFTEQSFNVLGGITYPSKEFIINLHKFLITHFRGQSNEITWGEIQEGNIDFLLSHIRYHHATSGKHEEQVLEKAAYMMHFLFTSHTFKDGNKRTSFVVTMLFLALNVFPAKVHSYDYLKNVKTFKKMASKKTGNARALKQVHTWLKENT